MAGLAILVALALLALGQQPSPPTPASSTSLRVQVDVVNVYCTVKDGKGTLVTDLQAPDFEVREDDRPQHLRYFAREADQPLSLILLVDTSLSQEKVVPEERAAIAQFLQQVVRPVDAVLLITFDAHLHLMQDFTADPQRLERALDRIGLHAPLTPGPGPDAPAGGTRLYDALYLAAKQKLTPERDRKAIILISDGADRGSTMTQAQALEATQRNDTVVYTIHIADPSFYWRAENRPSGGDTVLRELARETGGHAIFPTKPQTLSAAFDKIAAELRSQYRLGYSPSNRGRDGRFRRIEVKVNRLGLRVHARRGYYAPGS